MFKKYMSIMMLVLAFTVFAFGGVSSAKSKVLLYTSVPQSIIDKIRLVFNRITLFPMETGSRPSLPQSASM